MGSLGSWDASVSLNMRVDLKKSKENSLEDIQKFIKKNKQLLETTKSIDKLVKTDVLVAIEFYDEDDDELDYIELSSLGLKDVLAKPFIEDKEYSKHEELAEFDGDYSSPENWLYKVLVDRSRLETKLKFVNLKKLKDHIYGWDVNSPYIVFDSMELASCGDYIYCGNDNSSSDTFKVTKKFIDSLSVGDIIVLEGNGDGEHC